MLPVLLEPGLRVGVLVPCWTPGTLGADEPTGGPMGSATSRRAAESPGTVRLSLPARIERILNSSVSWDR